MGLFRLLLAISVFMAHTNNPKWIHGFGGENAVEIFFVISGFYIAMILDKTYSNKWNFYKNRFLRLYPIYYIICGLVLIRATAIPSFFSDLFHHPAPVLAVANTANATLFGTDWLMFLQWRDSALHFGSFLHSDFPIYSAMLIPQAWSLGIEVTFYLLAPSICRLRTRYVALLGLLLFGIKGLYWAKGLNVDPWSYRFFPFELPMFVLGILLYRLKRRGVTRKKISAKITYLGVISIYLIFGLVSSFIDIDRKIQFSLLFLFASAVILFAQQDSLDSRIGELSYPFYICHIFVISSVDWLILKFSDANTSDAFFQSASFKLPLMFVLTLLLSMILIRVMKPIENLRDRNRGSLRPQLQ
jgi:peptidoglycan/LPS O-acetylase OafA/YrhL